MHRLLFCAGLSIAFGCSNDTQHNRDASGLELGADTRVEPLATDLGVSPDGNHDADLSHPRADMRDGATMARDGEMDADLCACESGVEPLAELTIHIKKPSDWDEVSVHYWATYPANDATSWPGVALSDEGGG
ncbi:MAG: starch-binding protein, partial [Deltaproteobacteria bacterium]|nr:starch-binding protein [Deltaproteobacteria bacterium]